MVAEFGMFLSKAKIQEKFVFLFKSNAHVLNSKVKIQIQYLKIDSCTKFQLSMTNIPEQKIAQLKSY